MESPPKSKLTLGERIAAFFATLFLAAAGVSPDAAGENLAKWAKAANLPVLAEWLSTAPLGPVYVGAGFALAWWALKSGDLQRIFRFIERKWKIFVGPWQYVAARPRMFDLPSKPEWADRVSNRKAELPPKNPVVIDARTPVVKIIMDNPKGPQKLALTDDQRAFRAGLKQFALSTSPQLFTAAHLTLGQLIQHERAKAKGSAESVALAFFMHFAGDLVKHEQAEKFAKVDLALMDVDALQSALTISYNGYGWVQRAVGTINAIVGADLSSFPNFTRWLELDKEAYSELRKLKVWPEATKALTALEQDFATYGSNYWAEPHKINY